VVFADKLLPIDLPPELRCPSHHATLRAAATGPEKNGEVRGECGCLFPIRKGVPRFVPASNYADGFGIQWNRFRKTQLDSYTGTTISRDRLSRCIGSPLEQLRGARVLEIGCGAGRFTEVLLNAGANVVAMDLSGAVDANYLNCWGRKGYFCCQADVLSLPVAQGAFDMVVALGMLQHTPSPERVIKALTAVVRPGGMVVVDHYLALPPAKRWLAALTPRAVLRQIMIRLPAPVAFQLSTLIVRALLPIHRMLWRRGRVVDRVRAIWCKASPVFDYYNAYPELGSHLIEWALLDTHDGLTDRYKHLRTPDEISIALRDAGLEAIEAQVGGNGVEARARRPAGSQPGAS
jgi:SAM-dependent methyltransferase